MSFPVRRLLAVVAALGLSAAGASAQSPNCAQILASSTKALPQYSGTLPGSADMAVDQNGGYLYFLSQWGMGRASLADPLNPGPMSQFVIGKEGGSGNGGIIQINCDCHQGGSHMDVAEGPGGDSRMIQDWQPFKQGNGNSGLGAQLTKTSGGAAVAYGDQLNLSSDVPLTSRIAAIYLDPSSKYFGYFPTSGDNVQKVDLTNPNGSPDPGQALQPTAGIGWASDSSGGVILRAMHVATSGYNQYLLVGTTKSDMTLHVAQIDPSSGSLSEVASGSLVGWPIQFDVGVVNDQIFITSAESVAGLNVYEFVPPNSIQYVGNIPGNYQRAIMRGPQPFPGIFAHRVVSLNPAQSYIDIFDTKWLTQGGSPLLAKSIQHFGAPGGLRGYGVEAYVQSSGGTITAYLYREIGGYPDGNVHTDKIDISCIAADPTAPPIPFAAMTNLSSVARGDGVNYYGDNWSIADASVSYVPITELDWDFHNTGTFTPELMLTGSNLGGYTFGTTPQPQTNPQAYWPCDELNGGDLVSGTGCYQSLGTPAATYQLGLNSKNANGTGAPIFISSPIPVVAPQLSIVGYNGNTLQVLAGNPNNGDARASQGNIGDGTGSNGALFTWAFSPSGGPATGTLVTVPVAATSFILTAAYKGGYSASKSGTVSQVDLVPNFSLPPNPVLTGSSITLRNLMQKASAATLNSMCYAITERRNGTLPAPLNTVTGPR